MNKYWLTLISLLLIISCSNEKEGNMAISRDEDGIPLACEVLSDEQISSIYSENISVDHKSEKLSNGSQSCHFQLFNDSNEQISDFRIIIQKNTKAVNVNDMVKRIKNASLLDEMPFPVVIRKTGRMYSLTFITEKLIINIYKSTIYAGDEETIERAKKLAKNIHQNL
jgi:hypothetical protein